MGQTLSEPITEKVSEDGSDKRLAFGVSCMQGWRISMEDAHAAVLDLLADDPAASEHASQLSFFAVYDGHGGDKVAIYAGENVHNIVKRQASFKNKDYVQALKDGFLATDRAILNDPRYEEEISGCTATAVLISDDKIYCANAGDSRTVLGVKGRAKPLSYDHKPSNDGEKARIVAAGGFVDFGRVNGNLALSRAIGDFEFKKSAELSPEQQIVTAFPDVVSHDITDEDEFVVIACDGIWDCQSSQSVVELVRRGIAAKQDLKTISENMMDRCLAPSSDTNGVGCDNMTMMVIALLRGKTTEEWYQMIADRVEKGDGPCAPPEYAQPPEKNKPNDYEDDDDYPQIGSDNGQRNKNGRIIVLGDGTELLTEDNDDVDMFDQDEEHEGGKGAKYDSEPQVRVREDTPGPEDRSSQEEKPKEAETSQSGSSEDASQSLDPKANVGAVADKDNSKEALDKVPEEKKA